MKKKENQRVALTKRLLQESLLQLMDKKSIQDITVTELCGAAEINRSTFYSHYGSPTDVLMDIEGSVFDDLADIWATNRDGKHEPINRRVEALCLYLQEHKKLAKLLFRNSDTHAGFACRILNASHVRMTYEEELAGIEDKDSVRLAITFVTTGIYHMIRQWLLEDIPKTPREMSELALTLAEQGWARAGLPERGTCRPRTI